MRMTPPLEPPPRFGGTFSTDSRDRAQFGVSSGPVALRPQAVAAPAGTSDVAALVTWAGAEGLSLVPRGAGTGMPGGNVGRGVAVDLVTHMDRVGPVDPDRRTVTVGPGATLARIDAHAREAGLFLPPLPSSADRCAAGGAVANNAAGARTFGHGAIRDWVVGLEVVLADGWTGTVEVGAPPPPPFAGLARTLAPSAGRILARWPQVQKNSSGYALDRFLDSGDPVALLVGSEGTLGIVTGVTFRLAELPPTRALALLAIPGVEEVVEVARRTRAMGAWACEFFGRRFVELAGQDGTAPFPTGAGALAMVEVAGSAGETRAAVEAIRSLAAELDATVTVATADADRERLWAVRRQASPAVAEAARDGRVSTQFIEDSVVPVERLATYVRGVEDILADVGFDGVVFGHAGDGNVHVNPLVPRLDPDWRDRVRRVLDRTVDLVAGLGGTLSGEHGDGRIRAPFHPRIWSAETVEAFRTVKDHLDPDGRMNPGVVLPLPNQDPLEGLGAAWTPPGGTAPA